jgi:outer membrane protein W
VLLVYTTIHTPVLAEEPEYSISFFGSLSTSSKLFHHPNDPDEIVRGQFLPLNTIFSGGIDIRRSFESMNLLVGLNVEFISKTTTTSLPVSSQNIPVVDGFFVMPVELSGYFFIPVGNENISLYMGGGAGAYFGERKYEYAGVEAKTVDRKTSYGIHILSGVEYNVSPLFAIRTEVKFRDVQFETVKRFAIPTATYGGTAVTLNQNPFPSRINIDGMHLSVGVAYRF